MYWDASIVMLQYLESYPELIIGKTVLELGAGLGLTSIGCKILGAQQVIATDLPEVIPNLRRNLEFNQEDVVCRAFDWNDPCEIYCNAIIMTDVVWISSLIPPLIKTLTIVLNKDNYAIMCYKLRSNIIHSELLNELERNKLTIEYLKDIEEYQILKIKVLEISL